MKVKITIDRNAFSSSKTSALTKILRELGKKATITGDTIVVESDWDAKRVTDILDWDRVDYSVSH